MSTEPTADISSTQPDEQTLGGSTNTVALLEACIQNADNDALLEHLENNQTEQSVLDRCLVLGFQIVERKIWSREQKIERTTPALQLLLQFGAKWNPDFFWKNHRPPYHLICISAGDHHELLDLLIQLSERTLIDIKDDYECTALMHAGRNTNIKCMRKLISHGAHMDCKDQQGVGLLYWMIRKGGDDALRYLLDLGVTVPTYVSEACHEHCARCSVEMLVLDDAKQRSQDPCMLAIHMDRLDVVQLLEEYGSKSVQYFNAFRYAVMHGKITVAEYLHRKYRHPLNINYKVSVTNKH